MKCDLSPSPLFGINCHLLLRTKKERARPRPNIYVVSSSLDTARTQNSPTTYSTVGGGEANQLLTPTHLPPPPLPNQFQWLFLRFLFFALSRLPSFTCCLRDLPRAQGCQTRQKCNAVAVAVWAPPLMLARSGGNPVPHPPRAISILFTGDGMRGGNAYLPVPRRAFPPPPPPPPPPLSSAQITDQRKKKCMPTTSLPPSLLLFLLLLLLLLPISLPPSPSSSFRGYLLQL